MLATLERKPLGQILVGRGTVPNEVVERALEEQRRTNHRKLIGEILLDLRACTEEQVFEALGESYGIPFARISPRLADRAIAGSLPNVFLEKHVVLPLFLVEGTLTVAASDPANLFLVEEIERLTGHVVQVVAATARDVRATIKALTSCGDGEPPVVEESVPEVPADRFVLVQRRT